MDSHGATRDISHPSRGWDTHKGIFSRLSLATEKRRERSRGVEPNRSPGIGPRRKARGLPYLVPHRPRWCLRRYRRRDTGNNPAARSGRKAGTGSRRIDLYEPAVGQQTSRTAVTGADGSHQTEFARLIPDRSRRSGPILDRRDSVGKRAEITDTHAKRGGTN